MLCFVLFFFFFSQCRSCDNSPENCYFQISSYWRALFTHHLWKDKGPSLISSSVVLKPFSFIPDWCHFRYCSLTYNLLSGKNSLFCNRLYILKKASYHGKKIKQKKTTTTTKKTLLKFVSVTQAASCCSAQAFDMNDMAILIRCEQGNSSNKRKSVLQYHLFIQFTCQIYFYIYQWTKLFNFHGGFEGRFEGGNLSLNKKK